MIYINGDSFTAGAGVREEIGKGWTWPYLLKKKVDTKCYEEARSGCSNYRIYRYTLEQILTNKKLTAVIILWTHYQRQEFSIKGKNVTFMPSDPMTKKLASKVYDVAWKYAYNEIYLFQNWLRQIISIDHLCKFKKIKFYSFVYEDFWWDNTLKTFKTRANLNDLENTHIQKKFVKSKTLVDNLPKINVINLEDINLIQTGWAAGHPDRTGHEQICKIVHSVINQNS
tara:strand:+ start:329 stop:1009 length:681 start_codon:yes stop_codon:yes gene_type:complete